MHTPSAANIIRLYREANADQVARGATWYHEAHSLAIALDPENPRRAAGVIAALSPMMKWDRNVALAVRAYADGAASRAIGRSCDSANRILAGEDVTDVLRGPKVRAFAETIADPAGATAVVIDRHAHDIAIGEATEDAVRSRALARKGGYAAFAQAYLDAARVLGVAPSVVQATTWCVWRESRVRTAAANRREVAALADAA